MSKYFNHMMNYSPAKIKEVLDELGYVWYDKPYQLNIIGIRSFEERLNEFDDILFVLYKDKNGDLIRHAFQFTVDPGEYWAKNPMKKTGTAFLVPDQYVDVYKIDWHLGKPPRGYKALCQRNGPVRVYRDNNKDEWRDVDYDDYDGDDEGRFGINIHRSTLRGESTVVGRWSAGCQVFKKLHEFKFFMKLCKEHSKKHGNLFTYTLLEQEDFETEEEFEEATSL